jgi:hypothetical protein
LCQRRYHGNAKGKKKKYEGEEKKKQGIKVCGKNGDF